MTRDDIIRLAREVDAEISAFIDYHYDQEMVVFSKSQLERFAALVAAAEREACAKFLIDLYESDGYYHPAEEFTKQAVNAFRARSE